MKDKEQFENIFTLKDLYNNEIKQRYIRERMDYAINEAHIDPKTSHINRYDGSIFTKSCAKEINLNRDVCNFSKTEILQMYESWGRPSIAYYQNINSLFKHYTFWAIKEKISQDDFNHFDEIKLEDLTKIVNRKGVGESRITREQLDYWVDHWTEEFDKPNNKCDLAIVYLIFEGIRGNHFEDLLELTYDDVDYKKNIIKLKNGNKVKVSSKCIKILMEASQDESYYMSSGKEFPFLDNKIVRSYRKDQLEDNERTITTKVNTLKVRITKFLNNAGLEKKHVKLNNIFFWGQVDYVVDLLEKKDIKDVEHYMQKDVQEDVKARFRIENFNSRVFYERYKEYLVRVNNKLKED